MNAEGRRKRKRKRKEKTKGERRQENEREESIKRNVQCGYGISKELLDGRLGRKDKKHIQGKKKKKKEPGKIL